jgi:hypothetical protein
MVTTEEGGHIVAEPNFFDQFDVAVKTEIPTTNFFDQFDVAVNEGVSTPEPSEPGFVERTANTFDEAKTSITDSIMQGYDDNYDTSKLDPAMAEKFGMPTKSPMQRTGEVVSETLGAGSNILMDGGLTLIQSLVPDAWEDAIIDYSRTTWEKIAQSPVAREGLEVAKSGMEAYGEWAKENPDYAQAIGDAVAVGSLGRSGAPRRGDTYLKRQQKLGVSNRKGHTKEMLTPASKKNNYGSYYEDKQGTVRWDPNTWTREVIDEVVRVPEVNPSKSYVHNMNAVREASQGYKGVLDDLVSTKGTTINKQAVKHGLANKVNSLSDDTLLTGNPLDKAIKIYTKASKLIDEAEPEPCV